MTYSLFFSLGSNSSGKFPVIILVFSPSFFANDMVFGFILKIIFICVCKCSHVCNRCPWGQRIIPDHLESKLQTGSYVLPKVGPGNQIWVLSKSSNCWAIFLATHYKIFVYLLFLLFKSLSAANLLNPLLQFTLPLGYGPQFFTFFKSIETVALWILQTKEP